MYINTAFTLLKLSLYKTQHTICFVIVALDFALCSALLCMLLDT